MLKRCFSRTLSSQHQLKSLILATLRGASPHPSPHTPLPKTQISETTSRASPLPSRNRDHHCILHINSRHPALMGPLHLPANMNVVHLHCLYAQATTPIIHHQHCLKSDFSKRHLQEGRDGSQQTTPSVPQRWSSSVFVPQIWPNL
jgi:hypothetical protein